VCYYEQNDDIDVAPSVTDRGGEYLNLKNLKKHFLNVFFIKVKKTCFLFLPNFFLLFKNIFFEFFKIFF